MIQTISTYEGNNLVEHCLLCLFFSWHNTLDVDVDSYSIGPSYKDAKLPIIWLV